MSPLVKARGIETYEIELSRETIDSVLSLLDTGLFGDSTEAAIEEMVRHRVRELILEGWTS